MPSTKLGTSAESFSFGTKLMQLMSINHLYGREKNENIYTQTTASEADVSPLNQISVNKFAKICWWLTLPIHKYQKLNKKINTGNPSPRYPPIPLTSVGFIHLLLAKQEVVVGDGTGVELTLPDRVLVPGATLVVAVDHDVPAQGNPG